jgi:hypothetical protein
VQGGHGGGIALTQGAESQTGHDGVEVHRVTIQVSIGAVPLAAAATVKK